MTSVTYRPDGLVRETYEGVFGHAVRYAREPAPRLWPVHGAGEQVGILGGTFDPPHVGHVAAAAQVRHALGLDRVLAVPANVPWQKVDDRHVTAAADRLAMVEAAFAGVEGVEVSTVELDRPGDTYTIDTLDELRAAHPGATWYLVVGSDVAAKLDTWRRPDAVRAAARLVIYERPGSVGARPPAGWPYELVDVPLLDVSSTMLRDRVRRGEPVDGLVPPRVRDIIRARGLYREAA